MEKRYQTLANGMIQRIWPGKNESDFQRRKRIAEERIVEARTKRLADARARRVQAYNDAPDVFLRPEVYEGRIEVDCDSVEEDRGSNQYRIRLLRRGIRQLSHVEPLYDEGGWY